MKRHDEFQQNTEPWFDWRKKRIGGTRLKGLWKAKAWTKKDLIEIYDEFDVDYEKTKNGTPKGTLGELEKHLTPELRMALISTAPKTIEFYELLADHLGIEPNGEDVRDRGHRLEPEAAAKFSKETGKKLGTIGAWSLEEDDRIFTSPDREVLPEKGDIITEAVEIKCLSRARHLQAVVENIVPEEFESQKVQYFVVNPDLQVLWFVFYDPRVIAHPYHVVKVTREELGNKPQEYLEFQKVQLADIDKLVEELSW